MAMLQNTPVLKSSHAGLNQTFAWAVDKALSYVQTGKSGPIDRHERSAGVPGKTYEPSYWAGYTFRSAYYSRDFCHQAAGAQLLGLTTENYTMLQRFASTSTVGRKWFPLWAINFDGSPFKLDWDSDASFVREVPAVFELVEQCWQQYLWTGDKRYITDETLVSFCRKAMTDFIKLHDNRRPNGIAEGTGTGDIFKGSATYNEVHSDNPLVEAGDGIACQYRAHVAFANILKARGERAAATLEQKRAAALRQHFNTVWSNEQGSESIVRGYDKAGKPQTDWGLENTWFMPMKGIVDAGLRLDRLMELIRTRMDDPKTRPSNIEATSYIPDVFFARGDRESAWKWMENIHKAPASARDYPEISFTVISHVICGLLGVIPDAPRTQIATQSHLPAAIGEISVENISIGDARFTVSHTGLTRSDVTLTAGAKTFTWLARFPGRHAEVTINGKRRKADVITENGLVYSQVSVSLKPGQRMTVRLPA